MAAQDFWGVLASPPADVVKLRARWVTWRDNGLPEDYPRPPTDDELVKFWDELSRAHAVDA